VLLYELVSRYTEILFLRIYVAVALTLVLDTLLFITGVYVESPAFLTILGASMLGKLIAAVPYAILFTIYLRYFNVSSEPRVEPTRGIGATFAALTYRQKYELLRAEAVRDPLTHVYSRGFFNEALTAQIAMADRADAPLALLMLDIDHFKLINDSRGHLEGDRVLAAIAERLSGAFRSSDYLCRYGGEEFTVLLPNTGVDDAVMLAERARTAVVLPDGPTVTIGVAVYPGEARSAGELLELVDRRLYEGKRKGRNRVVA
jgi:diguanylate cyclase (GGDEF)-like protein